MAITDKTPTGVVKQSYIDQLAGRLLQRYQPAEDKPQPDSVDLPEDIDWIKQSFLLPVDKAGVVTLAHNDQQPNDRLLRKISSATLKYTDSSLGGNTVINPPPQFTRYADVRDVGLHAYDNPLFKVKGSLPDVSIAMGSKPVNYGQGSYYSEAIDDNSQCIHLRFGVPTYNSLTQFFTGFYNSGMASAARAGRFEDNFFNSLFATAGNLIGLAIMPMFIIPIAINIAGSAARYALGMPSTKFYYMKPTMPTYWEAVATIVNQMSSLLGVSNDFPTRQTQEVLMQGKADAGTDANGVATSIQSVISKFMPDGMMDETGWIDVRSIASRSKRLEIQFNQKLSAIVENAGPRDSFDKLITTAFSQTRDAGLSYEKGKLSREAYLSSWVKSWLGGGSTTTAEQDFRAQVKPKDDKKPGLIDNAKAWLSSEAEKTFDLFMAQEADGSDWVSFRVDYTGQVNSNFTSSTIQSSLANKINGMSQSNREIRFNFAEGNVLPGAEIIVNAVKSLASGIAEVVHLDGIASFAGSAFVDIPEHWDNSHADLPRSDYTIRLISPYGNAISQMFAIYIPLACLLAGALPLATGAQSYTSPFLCQLHDRGRSIIRLGMIERLSITLGTSNLGFTQNGHALAIDVNFTVKDMSSIMSIPITTGFSVLNPLQGLFDDQNAFSDYLLALCAVPLPDAIYRVAGMRYRLQQKYNDFNTYFSASHVASMLTGIPGTQLLNAIFKGTNLK